MAATAAAVATAVDGQMKSKMKTYAEVMAAGQDGQDAAEAAKKAAHDEL